ncbi:MAG: hypothetical protein V2B18_17870 [Pseudomonadota bacterium]
MKARQIQAGTQALLRLVWLLRRLSEIGSAGGPRHQWMTRFKMQPSMDILRWPRTRRLKAIAVMTKAQNPRGDALPYNASNAFGLDRVVFVDAGNELEIALTRGLVLPAAGFRRSHGMCSTIHPPQQRIVPRKKWTFRVGADSLIMIVLMAAVDPVLIESLDPLMVDLEGSIPVVGTCWDWVRPETVKRGLFQQCDDGFAGAGYMRFNVDYIAETRKPRVHSSWAPRGASGHDCLMTPDKRSLGAPRA